MAYDKTRYDEIQAMAAGDLVHAMLVEFDPDNRFYDVGEPGQPWQNGNAYLLALNRLNELLPIDDHDEVAAMASDAADATKNGF